MLLFTSMYMSLSDREYLTASSCTYCLLWHACISVRKLFSQALCTASQCQSHCTPDCPVHCWSPDELHCLVGGKLVVSCIIMSIIHKVKHDSEVLNIMYYTLTSSSLISPLVKSNFSRCQSLYQSWLILPCAWGPIYTETISPVSAKICYCLHLLFTRKQPKWFGERNFSYPQTKAERLEKHHWNVVVYTVGNRIFQRQFVRAKDIVLPGGKDRIPTSSLVLLIAARLALLSSSTSSSAQTNVTASTRAA